MTKLTRSKLHKINILLSIMVTKENLFFYCETEWMWTEYWVYGERKTETTRSKLHKKLNICHNIYSYLILEANCFILECWDNTQNRRKDLTIYNSKKTLLKNCLKIHTSKIYHRLSSKYYLYDKYLTKFNNLI